MTDENLADLSRDKLQEIMSNFCEKSQYAEAEEFVAKLEASGNPYARELYADILGMKGNFQGAADIYLELYKKNGDIAFKLGMTMCHLDRRAEAIIYLKEAYRRGYEASLHFLIAVYLKNNQPWNAIEAGKMALKYKIENSGRVEGCMGLAYMHVGEWDKAIDLFHENLKGPQKSPQIIHALTQCFCQKNDYKTALEWSSKDIKGGQEGAWFLRSQIFGAMKNTRGAIMALQRSLKVEPSYVPQASFALGQIFRAQKRIEKAMPYYEDAWLGGMIEAGLMLGEIAFEQRQFEVAEHWFYQVLERGHNEALLPLAHSLRMQEKFEESAKLFLRAWDSGNENAKLGLALLAVARKDHDEALSLFEDCVEMQLKGTNGAYGEFMLQRGDFGTAIHYLTKACEEDQDKRMLFPLGMALIYANEPFCDAAKGKLCLLNAATSGDERAVDALKRFVEKKEGRP